MRLRTFFDKFDQFTDAPDARSVTMGFDPANQQVAFMPSSLNLTSQFAAS